MTAVILIVVVILIVLALPVFAGARRGTAIANHLHLFGKRYDAVFEKTGCKISALEEGLQVFKYCPVLKHLSDDDRLQIALLISRTPYPKKVIEAIVMNFDSDQVIQLMTDRDFLLKIVQEYSKKDAEETVKYEKIDITKPTLDKTWRIHLNTGEIIEQFMIDKYRVTFLKITEQSSSMHYQYRALIFYSNCREPIISLNLESNPTAQTCCLGAHLWDRHENLGFADITMSAIDFKVWAVNTASCYLGLSRSSPPSPVGTIELIQQQ